MADIELKTAPADFRFPTTNQTRHCFTRYVEFHNLNYCTKSPPVSECHVMKSVIWHRCRCVNAKGEDSDDCMKFAKYYRALCPGEWVERWNEQRDNGTFPGPL